MNPQKNIKSSPAPQGLYKKEKKEGGGKKKKKKGNGKTKRKSWLDFLWDVIF